MDGSDLGLRIELEDGLASHLHLGPAHVGLAKQELSVQVAHFNGVQVNLRPNTYSERARGFVCVCVASFYINNGVYV